MKDAEFLEKCNNFYDVLIDFEQSMRKRTGIYEVDRQYLIEQDWRARDAVSCLITRLTDMPDRGDGRCEIKE